MPSHPYAAEPSVDVGGTGFDEPGGPELSEVVVDTDLTAAATCSITLLDTDRRAFDSVDYGQKVSVKAPSLHSEELIELFVGEVYALEFEADELGTYARITAFDHTYRLKQQRVTEAYLSMTDADVVTKIASDCGLATGQIDATSVVHEHLGQLNETHWDFLRSRAAANDFELFVSGGALHFRKPDDATSGPEPGGHDSEDPLQLTCGKNLTHLRTRISAAQQVGEVEVRGWNPKEKKELIGTAPARSNATELDQTAASLASKLGAETKVSGRPDLATQAECDAMAESLAQRTASGYAYAEGTALGDPRLVAGGVVAIGEAGPFDGQYTLTRARHIFRAGDYRTVFVVSGNHDRSRFGISHVPEPTQTWPGTYPAVVTNLKDPESSGRVKVTFPWLDGTYESDWCRVVQIGAGDKEGLLWYPEVGDEVVVTFLRGDPRRPIVHGALYNGKDTAPFPDHIDTKKGVVDVRALQSRLGHHIAFFDKIGEERIEVRTASGDLSIVLNDKNKAILIETSGELTVNTRSAVNIEGASDINVKASANISLEAAANARITAGANLQIEAGGTAEIRGAMVRIN